MGPDNTSWRDRFFVGAIAEEVAAGAAGLPWRAAPFCLCLLLFFRDEALIAADLAVDFFDTFLPAFLALPAVFLVDVFVAVTFLRDAFFAVDLRLDAVAFRPALRLTAFRDDFLRDAGLPLEAALVFAFFALIFRFLPVDLLPAEALRDALFFLAAPAAFCFLLAAFFAGMLPPAGPRKTRNYTSPAPTWKSNFRFPRGPQGPVFRGVEGAPPAPRTGRSQRRPAGARRRPETGAASPIPPSCLGQATIVLSPQLL